MGRGGRGAGRGRDFDRHSGSDRSGVRSNDKREGAGSNNWGSTKEHIQEEEAVVTDDKKDDAVDEGIGASGEESANEAKADDEPQEMTLAEYKALEKARTRSSGRTPTCSRMRRRKWLRRKRGRLRRRVLMRSLKKKWRQLLRQHAPRLFWTLISSSRTRQCVAEEEVVVDVVWEAVVDVAAAEEWEATSVATRARGLASNRLPSLMMLRPSHLLSRVCD